MARNYYAIRNTTLCVVKSNRSSSCHLRLAKLRPTCDIGWKVFSGGRMTRREPILAALLAAFLVAPGVGVAQSFKVDKFDIKGDGGTDYVAVEPATGRVFVSRATNLMVVDGATGKVLGDIPDTQ